MTFFDTNFILDILDDRRENHIMAMLILSAAERFAIEACISTQSIIDASYVMTQRKKAPVETFRKAISFLIGFLKVYPIDEKNIKDANQSTNKDYEDAAQLSCAKRHGCDIFVTSDKGFKKASDISVMTVKSYYESIFK